MTVALRATAAAVKGFALAAAVAAITGCAPAQGPTDETAFVDSQGYVEEFERQVERFSETLPPGAEFPAAPPPMEGDIEVSVGEAMVHFFWACSWERVYLTSADPEVQNAALVELKKFAGTHWALSHFDDSSGAWSGAIESAELGDPSELAAFHESDCSGFSDDLEQLG